MVAGALSLAMASYEKSKAAGCPRNMTVGEWFKMSSYIIIILISCLIPKKNKNNFIAVIF